MHPNRPEAEPSTRLEISGWSDPKHNSEMGKAGYERPDFNAIESLLPRFTLARPLRGDGLTNPVGGIFYSQK